MRLLQLEITGRCQLACAHCYADSGPDRGHGIMTTIDWMGVIDQAAALGIPAIQFIGGEPTLSPSFEVLLAYALTCGRQVEVYSNLVHIPRTTWGYLARPGVSIATSFYSDDPDQHAAITGRRTLGRTVATLERALALNIPVRAGIVRVLPDQRVTEAKALLTRLGVREIGVDRMRMIGRPTGGRLGGQISELCGNCGHGVAGILPDGAVAGCPMSRAQAFGDVRAEGLAGLLDRLVPPREGVHAGPCDPVTCLPNGDGNCEPSRTPGCDPGGQVCQPNDFPPPAPGKN
ncbi:radical SAM protein [Actinocorallia sp. API 0066]|uniref:radical SAM protein n=1 Tax=Actinocorallia sp. API 0066 TaxID=2896846 RepID=UPI001E2D2BF7|nr:radical SAM protein [Actinocorallia sp. API 0066]MCD0449096.1 radical SAM protein [Actinocorallia sp. API 0066]